MPVNKSEASSSFCSPAAPSQPAYSNGKKGVGAKSPSGRKIRKLGKMLKQWASPLFGKTVKQSRKSLQDYSLRSTPPRHSLESAGEIFVLEPTIKRLEKADDHAQTKAILAEDVHSIENLCALSSRLPDEVFNRMKGAFFHRLCTLEAKNHVGHMLDNCRDDKGALDSVKLILTLAQHREFISKTSANLFFTDGANYVKTRLTLTGTGPCELLCRIRGCSPNDFRLSPSVVLDSGASPVLKEAQSLGGHELKAARKRAAEMVEKQLKANHPEARKHLLFQFQAANDICHKMEEMLLEKLKPSDHEQLCEQMVTYRAKSCMEDIMLKVKSFDQLSQRLDGIAARYNPPGTTPVQLIAGLIGAKILHSDARLLGRVTTGTKEVPAHVRDEAKSNVGAGVARQLANRLAGNIEEMAANEGITDDSRISRAMGLVHALQQATDSMGEA